MNGDELSELIERYLAGPVLLRHAIEGLSPAALEAAPIAGQWSTRQVVCHLTDAEILYADRLKRIIAEDEPVLLKAEPAKFLAALGVGHRNLADELTLIEQIRRHLGQILRALAPPQFQRRGIHSTDGPLTLHEVLARATAHIPHHAAFIAAKRRALEGGF